MTGRSPTGQAGRASPEPASRLGHSATIPNARPNCVIDDKTGYLDNLARVGCDLRLRAKEGAGNRLLVDGASADEAGSLALRELATERGMDVQVVGKSDWHEGITYAPRAAQRIEAGTDETPKEVRPVGREPDGEADAPENKAVDPYALGGGK